MTLTPSIQDYLVSLHDEVASMSPDASFLHDDPAFGEVDMIFIPFSTLDHVFGVDDFDFDDLDINVSDEVFTGEDDIDTLSFDEEEQLDAMLGGDLELDGSESPVDEMVNFYTSLMSSSFLSVYTD